MVWSLEEHDCPVQVRTPTHAASDSLWENPFRSLDRFPVAVASPAAVYTGWKPQGNKENLSPLEHTFRT